jgi:hypothetical protein
VAALFWCICPLKLSNSNPTGSGMPAAVTEQTKAPKIVSNEISAAFTSEDSDGSAILFSHKPPLPRPENATDPPRPEKYPAAIPGNSSRGRWLLDIQYVEAVA